MKYILLLLLSLGFGGMLTAQNTIRQGFVTRMVDADTYIIKTLYGGNPDSTIRVRVVNVDAPEMKSIPNRRKAQEFSQEATDFVSALILNKEVGVTLYGRDNFDRVLAFIRINGVRLDDIMLRNGIGWSTYEYTPGKKYAFGKKLEAQARKEKLGLWGKENPIEPRVYRKVKDNL